MAFKCICISLLLSVVFVSAQAKNDKKDNKQKGKYVASVLKGCARLTLGKENKENPKIPKPIWIQTPSVVKIKKGHYQAFGRVIHLKYLREKLRTQNRLKFDATRKNMDLVEQLDILADTIYVEGVIILRGIKNVKVYAREIVASSGSKIDFSAPNWNQVYKRTVVTGTDGENGNQGINGAQVIIFCDVIIGTLDVISNGGNGHKGQDGGNGAKGRGSGKSKPDKIGAFYCRRQSHVNCRSVSGDPGEQGPPGGKGGNAGNPGNGGNAGRIDIRGRIKGNVILNSCQGSGAPAAKNGQGGQGGPGGSGGRGVICKVKRDRYVVKRCAYKGRGARARSGPVGRQGSSGSTPNNSGKPGSVSGSNIQSRSLNKEDKESYPVVLLMTMRSQAEDLLLGNMNDKKGRDALEFILNVVKERNDVGRLKAAVKRKLAFLGKAGYDIFGKNKLFAPRIKWEALEGTVEDIRKDAKSYEDAFNGMMSTILNNQNFQQMASKMSKVAKLQVKSERDRLSAAKLVAESEKRLYVKSIRHQQEQMDSTLTQLETILPDVYDKAKFNREDLLAVMQAISGFVSSAVSKSPSDFIDTAFGLTQSLSGKECLGSLGSVLDNIQKKMKFGEKYKPLIDSSKLDFDQFDVAAVPEIMKSNLEMNKEKLASKLVCLLDVASRPQDTAELKELIESFFIAGAARIDLIGKVMDLDNDIGGYNFDIPLLENTERAIADIGKPTDAPISQSLQRTFMDNLLSTYRELERSFMRNAYEMHKAFRFRTLWEGNNPLTSFQRVASESARGTGRLNGVVQLTNVLKGTRKLQVKAVKCFTNNIYTTNIQKWSFDNVKDKKMFQELAKGYTRFSLNIDKSCSSCYNIRLLKIYIELLGSEDQPANVPVNIHLKVRHLSGSYFRAGDNTIKQYRQPVGSYRKIIFDRFSISDENKCLNRKRKGKNSKCSFFCVTKDDSRWQDMCNNQLTSKGGCNQDKLLGMDECKSPFGTYELKIPVDKNLACDNTGIRNTNCKDLDLTKFTKMNVWTYFFYWSDQYPTGPDDRICRSPGNKRNETVAIEQPFPDDENLL